MEIFAVPPEDCLILKAFKDCQSLREAANLLNCDPAGLTRRVQQISNRYGFLQKVNNRWQLTGRGLDLVAWTEASIQSQKKVLSSKLALRIATTMWFSEELVIPNLPKLKTHLGGKLDIALSVPQKSFELALIDGSVDFVIVCHPPENPEIEHRRVAEEKWVLVFPKSWRREFGTKNNKPLDEIRKRPFISHSGVNKDLFLPDFPDLLDSGIVIDNLIGIRSAVCEGLGWSLVPKILVTRYIEDDRLLEIPYDIPIRDRRVCVWWLRNNAEAKRQSGKVSSWVKDVCS